MVTIYLVRLLQWTYSPDYRFQIGDDKPLAGFLSENEAIKYSREVSRVERSKIQHDIATNPGRYKYGTRFVICKPHTIKETEKSINDTIFADVLKIKVQAFSDNKSVFVLRLKWVFRYAAEDYYQLYSKSDSKYVGIFNSFNDAFLHSCENLPEEDPFEGESWSNDAIEYDSPIEIPIDILQERVREQGILPVDEMYSDDIEFWNIWWEVTTEHMSLMEKFRLKYQLGLLPFLENPFFYNEYNRQEGIFIKDGKLIIPSSLLSRDVNSMLPQLQALGNTQLRIEPYWLLSNWSEYLSPYLGGTKEQVLWWLIYPYPYEIIEVPLQ